MLFFAKNPGISQKPPPDKIPDRSIHGTFFDLSYSYPIDRNDGSDPFFKKKFFWRGIFGHFWPFFDVFWPFFSKISVFYEFFSLTIWPKSPFFEKKAIFWPFFIDFLKKCKKQWKNTVFYVFDAFLRRQIPARIAFNAHWGFFQGFAFF